MKSTGYRRSWYERRLPLPLRGLLVLVAGLGVLFCGQQILEGYRTTMVYRDAPVCEGQGCVRTAVGTVTGRKTGEHCTSDTSGGAAGTTGGGGTTCTRYYRAEVEWPGRTASLSVDSDTYDEVRAGDRAELRIWRGEVVGLLVRGHNHSYPPSSQSGVGPWLALASLILATGVWGAVSGRPSRLLAFPNFGWLFVAIGIGWLGSMALFGGHVLVWAFAILWTGFAVFWIVGAWRDG
ncbi:hypothetical protein J7E93_32735 [Streptomyces sp. ISL-36]|uniref:hypothetical protein n=1 Tax=Streptomyces sp. ISL-36 TaxID=2819182 RepID=UPI001BEC90B3|nr:hypothetical protein [Streptomyces sp. ISL-36]MBT2444780.1 hypothetical protein [Streptomyces sp. ISL-36]